MGTKNRLAHILEFKEILAVDMANFNREAEKVAAAYRKAHPGAEIEVSVVVVSGMVIASYDDVPESDDFPEYPVAVDV
jgi:hypothetical protein